MGLKEWADDLAANIPGSQVGKDHIPTIKELNNLVYLSMKYIAGFNMRDV